MNHIVELESRCDSSDNLDARLFALTGGVWLKRQHPPLPMAISSPKLAPKSTTNGLQTIDVFCMLIEQIESGG